MLEGWHFFFPVGKLNYKLITVYFTISEYERRYCRYFVSIISPLNEDLYTKQVVCIKKKLHTLGPTREGLH